MRRQDLAQFLQDTFGFAKVIEARQGASKSVELRISAHEGDPGKDWCEWWGPTTVSFLPAAGDEALFIDLGSERIVLAVKSRAFQQDLETGECIVRASGSPAAAYAKLKPDGTIELYGDTKLGGDTATAAVPLDTLLQTNLAAIATAITSLAGTYVVLPTASATVKAL